MQQMDQRIPVVYVAGSPSEPDAAERFARGIRSYADRLNASGVVLLGTYRHRAGDPPAVILDSDPHEAPRGFALLERAASLLQEAGLTTELGWPWPREHDVWSAMRTATVRAAYPVIQVSVPSRFGLDLTVLATRALQPLRHEGVLLVGISTAYADAVRRSRAFDEPSIANEIRGIPV